MLWVGFGTKKQSVLISVYVTGIIASSLIAFHRIRLKQKFVMENRKVMKFCPCSVEIN
jgi:hypothetical protein